MLFSVTTFPHRKEAQRASASFNARAPFSGAKCRAQYSTCGSGKFHGVAEPRFRADFSHVAIRSVLRATGRRAKVRMDFLGLVTHPYQSLRLG